MIHIVTDTTAGLSGELARSLEIPMIPQVVLFGEESFLEGSEIDNATFLRRLQSEKNLPKTAAPPPGLFVDVFQRLAGPGNTILCIHPSSDLSGTVRSALTAAEEFPGADIRVLDTRSVAGPLASMVLLAHRWAGEGLGADAIMARLQALIPRARIFFLVDTLEYLQKGGRIGGASALIGSILQVKPILELRNGRVEPLERERTHKRALARLKELVVAQAPKGPDSHLSILHAGAPEAALALAADLCQKLGVPAVEPMDVPPAIVTHAGPGLLGVGFFAAEAGGGGTELG